MYGWDAVRVLIDEKLVIGTTTLHYLCGRLDALESDTAVFLVGTQRIRIPLAHVASVVAASPVQAEFVK